MERAVFQLTATVASRSIQVGCRHIAGALRAQEGQSHGFAPPARNSGGVITDAYGYYPGGDQPMSLQLPSGRTGVFITDPQLRGTVRAIMDADKNATNPEFKTYAVSPWGEVAADTGTITRLRMAGQQYDQGSRKPPRQGHRSKVDFHAELALCK